MQDLGLLSVITVLIILLANKSQYLLSVYIYDGFKGHLGRTTTSNPLKV